MLVENLGRFAGMRGRKKKERPKDPLGAFLWDIRYQLAMRDGKPEQYGIYEMKKKSRGKGGPKGIDGTLWSRMESGEKRPGYQTLEQLRQLAVDAGLSPRALLFAWLEACDLHEFVRELKRKDGAE